MSVEQKPLHDASRSGDTESIMRLLARGATDDERDDFGWTALHCSCYRGQRGACELLVDGDFQSSAKDHEGYTPVHLACLGEHLETLRSLLERSADAVDTGIRGSTPLFQACSRGNGRIARLLLDCLADAHSTPLHHYSPTALSLLLLSVHLHHSESAMHRL